MNRRVVARAPRAYARGRHRRSAYRYGFGYEVVRIGRGRHRRPRTRAARARFATLALAFAATAALSLPMSVWAPFGRVGTSEQRQDIGGPSTLGDDGDPRGPILALQPELSTVVTTVPSTSWTAPVLAPISSGFRTIRRPGHDGVDLAAPHGTAVRAAASGTVLLALCDPATRVCDRDGSLSTPGCGWYVVLVHAGGVVTRYCHLMRRPDVRMGQEVQSGQIIGYVGASGHATGPHLHFEVRLRDRADQPVDPVKFLAQRGVRLGLS
jgi:murein DD-endopeptidase MepM/ murein hydrolase activator NlpD